jgi:hypothetical protein
LPKKMTLEPMVQAALCRVFPVFSFAMIALGVERIVCACGVNSALGPLRQLIPVMPRLPTIPLHLPGSSASTRSPERRAIPTSGSASSSPALSGEAHGDWPTSGRVRQAGSQAQPLSRYTLQDARHSHSYEHLAANHLSRRYGRLLRVRRRIV